MLTAEQVAKLRASFTTANADNPPAGVLTRVLALIGDEVPRLARVEYLDQNWTSGRFVVITSRLVVQGTFKDLPPYMGFARNRDQLGTFTVEATHRRKLASVSIDPEDTRGAWVPYEHEGIAAPWRDGGGIVLRYPAFSVAIPLGRDRDDDFYTELVSDLLNDLG